MAGLFSRQRQAGIGAPAIGLIIVVVGIIGFIGWQVVKSHQSGGLQSHGGLVPVPGPKQTDADNSDNSAPDSVPAGYSPYSNDSLGFTFVYPTAWGALQPVADKSVVLSLATPTVQGYSLADALQVQVIKKDAFHMPANDEGVIISPSSNGATYNWIVTDKGKDRVQVGQPYSPQPSVIYQSGKAQVYDFLASQDSCTYDSWAFAVRDTFVKLRLPSFCISSKPGDTDVQAGQKADFDNAEDTILHSITVL